MTKEHQIMFKLIINPVRCSIIANIALILLEIFTVSRKKPQKAPFGTNKLKFSFISHIFDHFSINQYVKIIVVYSLKVVRFLKVYPMHILRYVIVL